MDGTRVAEQITWERVVTLLDQLQAGLRELIVAHGMSWLGRVVPALLVFWVGQWGANLVVRAASRAMERARVEETLAKFLARFAYAALMCAVTLAALRNLGVDTSSLTAILAAGGLAVGLALQGSLSNFAAGIMIIVFRPFRVGQLIEAGGARGIIEEITIFHTLMRTPDNIQLIVPNGAITSGNITNFSSKPTRRVDLVVTCSYHDDLRQVRALLEQIVQSDPRVLADPKPVVAVDQLAEHGVKFVVQPWVRSADYSAVKWDLTERIKTGFDERGFNMASVPQWNAIAQHLSAMPMSVPADEPASAAAPSTRSTNPSPSTPFSLPWPSSSSTRIRPRRAA